jgi:1-acyl-sn-glycerol-3-phosphate acyltransferase
MPQQAEEAAPPAPEPTEHRVTRAAQWANYLFFLPAVGFVTAFFGCISFVCGLWDKSGRQQHPHLGARHAPHHPLVRDSRAS